MPEVVAVACLFDDIPCQLVHVSAGDAGFCAHNAGSLGFQHDIIDLLHSFAGLSHADGTGHVAVIAVHHSAVIHQYEIAALHDTLRRGYAVGHGSGTARQRNGGERFPF